MPTVSVIVTTRNEADRIGALMRSLAGQAHLHEVILVDADSEDGTVDVAKNAAAGIRLLTHVEPCSRGAGRNMGAELATGDVLAFIDGDCTATPGWLAALVAAMDDDQTVAAGHTDHVGRFRPKRAPLMVDGQDIGWPSCNLAYPAALFHQLGGFDADFRTAEDMDLNLRAVHMGARIHHAPAAIVHATTRDSTRAYRQQAFDYGVGRAQLEAKHGAVGRTSKWKALWSDPTPAGLMRLWNGYRGYRHERRNQS